MKKIFNIFLLVAAATMALTSCDDPNYPAGQTTDQGELKMTTLGIDVDASENKVIAKSGIDVSNFVVKILDANTSVEKGSWAYSKMPEIVTLPVGDYSLVVYNAEVQEAAFDAPYYYAKKAFTIAKNQITELDKVTCTLQNVKVSVVYSDDLKELMSDDVNVKVEVAEKNTLDFSASETRAGYFRYYDNNKTLVASFSGTVDGVFISEDHKIVTDVAPRKHYIITFSYKRTPTPGDESGSLSSANFTVDATLKVENVTRNIDIDDEIIEPFDFLTTSLSKVNMQCSAATQAITVKSSAAWTVKSEDTSWCTVSDVTSTGFNINVTKNDADQARTTNVVVTMGSLTKTIKVTQAEYSDVKPAPSFSSETIDLDNFNDAAEFGSGKKNAIVNISAPNGIKSLFVNINSDTLTPDILQSVGLDSQFDLATGATPGGKDLTAGLVGLGFPVANGGTINGQTYGAVIDETSVEFNITEFIPLLSVYGAGNHLFELTVTDNAGQVSKATIKFQTK